MNKYKKFAIITVIIEIIAILICNVWFYIRITDTGSRLYRVEAKRVALELQNRVPEEIDLSHYRTITDIRLFSADEICNQDYLTEEINGKLYRIIYQSESNYSGLFVFNACSIFMLIMNVFVFMYIWNTVLRPFHKMSDLTYELAKGNLNVPLKAQKNKVFGKFLWGMDMLRENLEDGKQKELELQKEKKTLILSLSHDIKTPLSAIDMSTKALQENLYDSEEKRNEVLNKISGNVREIKSYVDKIVTATRDDFLNLEVNNGEFYLQQILTTIEGYYSAKLAVLHTDFIVEGSENCLLYGDADRVIEVLQNVMENAIKYGDGKQIRLSVSEEEDCKLIQIENTGCSLKPEDMASIFDSFYRGSNSHSVKGNGLGLYISKNLMTKMEGSIFAGTQETNFVVTTVIRKA